MKKSFHTTGKVDYCIEQGSSGLGNLFCWIFAILAVIWLCHDTSAGLSDTLSRSISAPYSDASTLGLILEWL